MNLRDDTVRDRSLRFFLLEGPPVVPPSFTDLEEFESKIDELYEVSSAALKETGPPFWDGSRGCPTLASRWGGGNFSLLLLAFAWVTTLHL